jgi:hypothetical protein
MLARLSTKAGKRAMRKRAATVEPVLGSLIEYYGLRKISVKKREGAAKVMYMAATAYNLKKYLRYGTSNPLVKAVAISVIDKLPLLPLDFCNSHSNYVK